MTRMTTTMVAMAMAMAMAAGCNSGDDSDTEGASGTEALTTGTPTTGGEISTGGTSTGGETSTGAETSTGETPTTGGAAALTPADLVGNFKSAGCENYPNGMGGENYLTRDFTLTETNWHLELVLYGDAGCTAKLFSSVIDGPYTLLDLSATVAGATEGNFGAGTNVWTAHMQNMADTFTMAGCGAAPWEVEVPQDVAVTGCIGVAHPIAECPTEHDVVSLDGDDLYFGQRITDMCSEAGRPTALAAFPVVRT